MRIKFGISLLGLKRRGRLFDILDALCFHREYGGGSDVWIEAFPFFRAKSSRAFYRTTVHTPVS